MKQAEVLQGLNGQTCSGGTDKTMESPVWNKLKGVIILTKLIHELRSSQGLKIKAFFIPGDTLERRRRSYVYPLSPASRVKHEVA